MDLERQDWEEKAQRAMEEMSRNEKKQKREQYRRLYGEDT